MLHKPWIAERTQGWPNCYRCRSKDYDEQPANSGTGIRLATVDLMLYRIAPS